MRRVLVAIILLSTTRDINATNTEDFFLINEDHPEIPITILNNRFWWNHGKRALEYFDSRNNNSEEVQRTIETLQPKSRIEIRCSDPYCHQEAASSFAKSRLSKPAVLVAATFHELSEKNDRSVSYNWRKRYYHWQQGWKVQGPLYAEEPSWIQIDSDRARNLRYRDRLETTDPFVISRGKKSTTNNENVLQVSNENCQQILGENSEHCLKETGRSIPEKISTSKNREKCEPVSFLLRNKRFDILDALQEPYFVGRGKKRPSKRDEIVEFGRSKSTDSFDNKKSLTEKGNNGRTRRTRFGDRRTGLEDILSMSDPFYVARGKRIGSPNYSCRLKMDHSRDTGEYRNLMERV